MSVAMCLPGPGHDVLYTQSSHGEHKVMIHYTLNQVMVSTRSLYTQSSHGEYKVMIHYTLNQVMVSTRSLCTMHSIKSW